MKRNEPVSHIMTKNPYTAHLGQPPSEVRDAFQRGGFHHVPVTKGGKLVGIVTSTDLLRATYEVGTDDRMNDAVLDHTRSIEDLMVADVTTLGPKDTIRNAFEVLAEGRFHAIPIVEDDVLVGIVTTTDLLRYTLDQY